MIEFKDLRKDFGKKQLNKSSLKSNPFNQFMIWMKDAIEAKIPEANAMVLSTVNNKNHPSSRVVLLKNIDYGFVFYTNYSSKKGIDLSSNPNAALLFFWADLERQLRIQGVIAKTSKEESDIYFNSRPRKSQLSAIISPQSNVIKGCHELELKLQAKENDGILKRPPDWGGYRLTPNYFEFWQGRPNRLHNRFAYFLENGSWAINQLAP